MKIKSSNYLIFLLLQYKIFHLNFKSMTSLIKNHVFLSLDQMLVIWFDRIYILHPVFKLLDYLSTWQIKQAFMPFVYIQNKRMLAKEFSNARWILKALWFFLLSSYKEFTSLLLIDSKYLIYLTSKSDKLFGAYKSFSIPKKKNQEELLLKKRNK